MKWLPNEDMVSFETGALNFAKVKKQWGKKSMQGRAIPLNLTGRQCVSKVTPITATKEIEPIHVGCKGSFLRCQNIWWFKTNSHFKMIQKITKIKFKCAFVPYDAVNLNISQNDADDVGKNLAYPAIYARFLKKNGTYSCQLAFSLFKDHWSHTT